MVVAAGCGTAALTGLPVRPVKGQVLRLRGEPGLLRHVISGYADGRHVYLVPRADGEIVVGATQEERTDHAVTAGGVLDLLRAAVDLVPALADFELVETLAGHRPATPDNAPLLGRLDDRTRRRGRAPPQRGPAGAGHRRPDRGLVVTGDADPMLDATSIRGGSDDALMVNGDDAGPARRLERRGAGRRLTAGRRGVAVAVNGEVVPRSAWPTREPGRRRPGRGPDRGAGRLTMFGEIRG